MTYFVLNIFSTCTFFFEIFFTIWALQDYFIFIIFVYSPYKNKSIIIFIISKLKKVYQYDLDYNFILRMEFIERNNSKKFKKGSIPYTVKVNLLIIIDSPMIKILLNQSFILHQPLDKN
jgi:hypothetical protein